MLARLWVDQAQTDIGQVRVANYRRSIPVGGDMPSAEVREPAEFAVLQAHGAKAVVPMDNNQPVGPAQKCLMDEPFIRCVTIDVAIAAAVGAHGPDPWIRR